MDVFLKYDKINGSPLNSTVWTHGSAYTWIFLNNYMGKLCGDLQWLEKTPFSSLLYSKNTICVKWLFIVTGKASGQMRHLVVKFLGSQKSSADFWLHRDVGMLLALLKGQPHFMGEWPVRLCAAHTLLNLPWEETQEQVRGHTADTRAGLGRGVWLHTQEAGETTAVFTSYCLQREEHLESRSQQLHLTDTNNSWR